MSDDRPRVLFLGGNGHCTERLAPARAALKQRGDPFSLLDVPYPGFEGRPRAPSFEAFLGAVRGWVGESLLPGKTLVYGTGIGGLIGLALRAQGDFLTTPLLLQGAVLWGLKTRWFPILMRLGLAPLLPRMFGFRAFQDWFVRRKMLRPPAPEVRRAFFDGYNRCTAAGDFFDWLTPALLAELEKRFAANPDALNRILAWWGGRDSVVSLGELELTERALNVQWPRTTFSHWGHYPMLDDPDDWVRALGDVVAESGPLHR